MRFLLADLSDRMLRFLSVHTLQQHAGFVGTLNFYKYPPCVMWGTLACQLLQIVSRLSPDLSTIHLVFPRFVL